MFCTRMAIGGDGCNVGAEFGLPLKTRESVIPI